MAKVTATDLEPERLTEQVVPELLVHPDHPLTPKPAEGTAVNVTVDPVPKLAVHTEPQFKMNYRSESILFMASSASR